MRTSSSLLLLLVSGIANGAAAAPTSPEPTQYTIAFASFAPLNTDLFIADADGSNAHPLLAHPDLDCNASFSADGRWIVFTSRRGGSSDIYRAHPDGTGLERLTDDPAFDDQATLSPDGKRLAFVSNRSGQADIWILNLKSKVLKNLTNTPAGEFRPAWSPDGKRLAFSSDRDSTRPRGNGGFETVHSTELYVVRSDGAQQRRLTNDQAFAGSPSWSADGQSLVFYRATVAEVDHITSPRRLRGITQIATLNLRAAERHDLTSGPGEKWSPRWLAGDRVAYVSGGPDGGIERTGEMAGARGEFGSPSWTADGRRMVFHREVDHEWPPHRTVHSLDAQFNLVRTGVFPSFSPAGDRMISNDRTAGILQNSILVMNADGSNRSVLFSAPDKSALAPAWSPRGSDIAFSIGHFFQMVTGPARGSIAIVHIDGTGLQLLTDDSVNCGFPSWSRDGEQIVYRASGASEHGLFVIDIRTHASRLLTSSAAHDNFPAWSPTSDVIAFTSDRDGDYEVYTIRANGMHLQRLTHSPGNDAHNSWSPDGKWIAFTSQRGGFKDESALHPYNPQPYGDIYVMHADGSDVRQLTDDQFEESTPVWAPLRGVQ